MVNYILRRVDADTTVVEESTEDVKKNANTKIRTRVLAAQTNVQTHNTVCTFLIITIQLSLYLSLKFRGENDPKLKW